MRLIDADALQNILLPIATALEHEYGSLGGAVSGCMKHIDNAPTVDAVPVVRCEKCEHWVKNDDGQCVCALFDIANSYGEPVVTKPDDFCSYGKRKGKAD